MRAKSELAGGGAKKEYLLELEDYYYYECGRGGGSEATGSNLLCFLSALLFGQSPFFSLTGLQLSKVPPPFPPKKSLSSRGGDDGDGLSSSSAVATLAQHLKR